MRLRVLGCAGGSAPDRRLSCYLFDGVFAIDAGALTTGLSVDGQRAVEAVAFTHGHLDHVWSFPLFLANRFGAAVPTCHVYADNYTMVTIRDHLFNDRIWPDFTSSKIEGRNLVDFHDVEAGDSARVLDRYDIQSIPLNHTVPCQGYRVRADGASLIVCGDTCTTDAIWAFANEEPDLKGILVECSFTDKLTELALASKHMTPSLLRADLEKLTVDVPVYVMHRKPGYGESIIETLKTFGDDRIRILEQDEVLDVGTEGVTTS